LTYRRRRAARYGGFEYQGPNTLIPPLAVYK
jgi:hypothetical protein